VRAYAETLRLVDGALSALEAERQVINDLNVYPVPDGDTGTNLYLTVHAVREELERAGELESAEVAPTVARGSLMGARGNSGVILSQIVRGLCAEFGPGKQLTTTTVKAAFGAAATAAYRAVKKPVEGTMLTVVREMATAAADLRDETPIEETMETILAAGALAVERTTNQLAALREAGVVDAGGYGLLVICRGLTAAALGAPGDTRRAATPAAVVPVVVQDGPAELSRYRYCTSFLLTGPELPRDELEELLTDSGDSELVVGDAGMLKVHVHTDDPGAVLSWAVRHGSIGEVEINDMHEQTRERDERLSAGREHGRTVVVAVAAGAGNQELFREVGCGGIVDGGQSMNPSAAQLLAVVDELGSDEVVVLPNNKNIVLTAEQAAAMTTRTLVVVPSTSIPAGLAAMVAFDPAQDAVSNGTAMAAAVERAHSGEITVAVRDSVVDDVAVSKDEFIGLVDGRLVAGGAELVGVLEGVLEALAEHDPEVITVLTSVNGAELADDEISAAVSRRLPEAEVQISAGGQPLYPILVGAE